MLHPLLRVGQQGGWPGCRAAAWRAAAGRWVLARRGGEACNGGLRPCCSGAGIGHQGIHFLHAAGPCCKGGEQRRWCILSRCAALPVLLLGLLRLLRLLRAAIACRLQHRLPCCGGALPGWPFGRRPAATIAAAAPAAWPGSQLLKAAGAAPCGCIQRERGPAGVLASTQQRFRQAEHWRQLLAHLCLEGAGRRQGRQGWRVRTGERTEERGER